MPYIPLYVNDFFSDGKLRDCSAEAIGIYVYLLCVLHESSEYGKLKLNSHDECSLPTEMLDIGSKKILECEKKFNTHTSVLQSISVGVPQSISTSTPAISKICEFSLKLTRRLPFNFLQIVGGIWELLFNNVININDRILSQKRMIADNNRHISKQLSGSKGWMSYSQKSKRNDKNASILDGVSSSTPKSEIENDNVINNKNKDCKGEECEQSFDKIWDLYDKKRGDKKKLIAKWSSLSQKDKAAIFAYVPKYVQATPNKQYRKDFATFLNNRSWNDEIIDNHGDSKQNNRAAAGNHCQGDAAAQGISEDKSFTTTL